MPLNVGSIGAYLKQEIKDVEVEIFKDPGKLYEAIVAHPRGITCLALSNYAWNFNLNRHFLDLAKRVNPEIITVMGGPNIDADSDAGLLRCFNHFPSLDFYIIGEGEYKLAALMNSIIGNGMDIRNVWGNLPQAIVGFDKERDLIIKGSGNEIGCCECSTLPSPYLTGILDEFFHDPHLVPVIETNRGCPYSCAYCCWGNAVNSGMRLFDKQRVMDELQYIAMKSKHPLKGLYIADSNFGILERDLEIAHSIKALNARDGSFRSIYLMSAKQLSERVVEIAETLKDLTDISMSKQTLNPVVLKIIGRENIPDDRYDYFLTKLGERGVSTYCELIYGLPGESYESFMDGLIEMSRKGMRIALYPLLMIKGARINSEEFRVKYDIRSAFRIMTRYTGSYGEIDSAEYEEILISHSQLPEDDFIKMRVVFLLYAIFGEKMFEELVTFLKENALDMASLYRFIMNERANWPDILEEFIQRFEVDVKGELIGEKDLKLEFTREEIESVKENTLDLNVYYMCLLISSRERMRCFKEYVSDALDRYFCSECRMVDTGELRFLVDLCFDRIPDFPHIKRSKFKSYQYDVESWLKEEGNSRLSSFKTSGEIKYLLELDEKPIEVFDEHYRKLKDKGLSLYRTRMRFRTADPSGSYTYRRSRC